MMGKMHPIALLPRDGLFCKDGRGWHTSASGRGHALDWPWPSTLRGALLTAWGRRQEVISGTTKTRREWLDHKQDGDVTLGKSLALRRPHGQKDWQVKDRVWPAPTDALWLEGTEHVWRLDPQKLEVKTLGRDEEPAREALWVPPPLENRNKPRKAPRWLCETDFIKWLSGGQLAAGKSDDFISPVKRVQAHVGIDDTTFTHKESILFSHDVLEMLGKKHEWAIGVQAELINDDLPELATVGSDGRLSRIDRDLSDDLFAAPEELLSAFDRDSTGLRLVIVTPAKFEKGWLPNGFEVRKNDYVGTLADVNGEVILRAAFVPRPLHVSGWDVANNCPKGTDRMVPPGAVYFFQREDGKPFKREHAEKLWLAPLGKRQEEGFGRVVPGIWNVKGSRT